jgi:membrane protease YdiL (CAAX protease family)
MTAEADAPRGRPLRALLLYLVAVFAGGALLAPWLYLGVQALAAEYPALGGLARMPFARYVNRALIIAALVGLPFFIRAAGIRRWADVGVAPGLVRWRPFAVGFGLGFMSLAVVCAVALVAGGRLPRPRTPGDLAAQFLGALATALVVAVIEELLFRGAFFGGLRGAVGWKPALAASSLLYGIVHFMARPANPPTVDWLSGLRVLPTMLGGMTEVRTLIPGLLSLALAGVILGLAYQWTGELSASIGIHAGWIFWLKYYGLITKSAPGADVWFWGTRRLTDGWLAFVSIVIVLALLLFSQRISRRGTETPRSF